MARSAFTIADLRDAARRRLPKAIFDTIEGGAGSEVALERNLRDLATTTLTPRVLRDVGKVDTSTDLLGRRAPLPLILGPTGMSGFYWPDGELAVADAAERAGVPYVVSAVSSVELERLAKPGRRLWFQLYPLERRDINEDLIARAKAAGYEALVITVDVPRIAVRMRDVRNGVQLPPRLNLSLLAAILRHPRWALPFVIGYRPSFANLTRYDLGFESSLRKIAAPRFDARMNWDGLAHLASRWDGPMIVKGLMHRDDVVAAASAGATAVVISNHGGRQLDCAPSTLAALRTVDSIGSALEIYVDGGVRAGGDIAKFIASGAKAVLVGRAYLYGLAARGSGGVGATIDIFRRELEEIMALTGCPDLDRLAGISPFSEQRDAPARC